MSDFLFTTHNLADTEALAAELGRALRGGEAIELISDIGGGKTAFVKGLAKGLDITETVQSPTFTISRIYPARDDLELHHFDFYRLSEGGVVADELAESLHQVNAVVAVEWGEIVHDVLPVRRLTVKITTIAETDRQITITIPDDSMAYIHEILERYHRDDQVKA